MVNFGWLKFSEPQMTRQICQTFLLPNIPAIQYFYIFISRAQSYEDNKTLIAQTYLVAINLLP